MPGAVAGIALPEGDPGAIFDAARELQSIAGAFEGGGGVVSSGVAQVGSWQGQASASFRALAGSYEQAARTSAAVLQEMAGAVRAYGREFRDAYERVKRLQERAEECLREIDLWEARRDDAAYRERALQAERRAASQVLSAVDGLPAVGMPGGPANGAGPGGPSPAMSMVPAVYRGGARSENAVYRGGAQSHFTDFSIQDILGFSRDVDREMGPVDEKINEGVEAAGDLGRELSGINDAQRSWDAFGRGDIFGGLFYGALASPVGKWPKAGKEVVEEGVVQGGRRASRGGGGGGAPSAPPARQFVTTPRGTSFDVPAGWTPRTADNGKGIVYQRPGATGNADSIRIMEPTPKYPDGYFRYYNSHGQPLDVNGKPGSQSATHIPEKYLGRIPGWPTK